MEQKIWFITGISSGLGKALAAAVMQEGDFVIGTFRNQAQADHFNNQHPEKAFALKLDISQTDDIENAISIVQNRFQKIDVLVNNAGYGIAGAIEETNIHAARAIFETNFFGTLQLTQKCLPMFRAQKSGHIIQISSHGGFKAFAGFGIYNATKFALEGFSEALAAELAPLGIKLTIVQPGPFRTNFAGSSFQWMPDVIEDYAETAGLFRERIQQVDGRQEGDPGKAAQAIIHITQTEKPPLRLPLGKTAIATLTSKLQSVQSDLDNYSVLAASAVF